MIAGPEAFAQQIRSALAALGADESELARPLSADALMSYFLVYQKCSAKIGKCSIELSYGKDGLVYVRFRLSPTRQHLAPTIAG